MGFASGRLKFVQICRPAWPMVQRKPARVSDPEDLHAKGRLPLFIALPIFAGRR